MFIFLLFISLVQAEQNLNLDLSFDQSKGHYCVACEHEVTEFLPHGDPIKIGRCPVCGAKGRHRIIYATLDLLLSAQQGLKILEIGPSKPMTRSILRHSFMNSHHYQAIDIRSLDHHRLVDFTVMDATQMEGFSDSSFDIVLANHVLQFIPDYLAALQEIKRVLRPTGIAILNVFKSPHPTMPASEFRKIHPELTDSFFIENASAVTFGTDYLDILRKQGFFVEEIDFNQGIDIATINYNGISGNSGIVLATKDQSVLSKTVEQFFSKGTQSCRIRLLKSDSFRLE